MHGIFPQLYGILCLTGNTHKMPVHAYTNIKIEPSKTNQNIFGQTIQKQNRPARHQTMHTMLSFTYCVKIRQNNPPN